MKILELNNEIDIVWEKYRLSGRKKMWTIDLEGRRNLENLYSEFARERKREYARKLKELGIINFSEIMIVKRHAEIMEARLIEFMTLEETGKKFGVTRERIRQIEQKFYERLNGNKEIV